MDRAHIGPLSCLHGALIAIRVVFIGSQRVQSGEKPDAAYLRNSDIREGENKRTIRVFLSLGLCAKLTVWALRLGRPVLIMASVAKR